MLNLTGKKNIAFFGCSFTAGHELADHDLLGVSFDECNRMKMEHLRAKRTLGEFDQLVKDTANITQEEYNEISSRRSYAGKLARKLNLNQINFAEPGLAAEHSAFKFFDAFYSGKLNPETDVIFFGLTTPHRYLFFDSSGTALTRVMSHEVFFDEDLFHNDYKIMQSYYFAVQNCMNFCLRHSFEFVLQPVVTKHMLLPGMVRSEYEMFLEMDRNWQYLHMFRKMLDEFMKYSVDDTITLRTGYLPEKHGVCGFKHPTEIAHKMFAENLYAKIISQQN